MARKNANSTYPLYGFCNNSQPPLNKGGGVTQETSRGPNIALILLYSRKCYWFMILNMS